MILSTAFDRVMQLAWRRGRPTIDDIRQAMPVDGVTTEDLGNMVARVRKAGIPVGTDPALLNSPMTETTCESFWEETTVRPQLKQFTIEKTKSRMRVSRHHGAFGLGLRSTAQGVVGSPVLSDRIIGTIHVSRPAHAVENNRPAG